MTAGKAMPPLSARQQRFVELYCLHLEAARAAAEAGYSKRNAKRIGYQLLQKPQVQAAISAHRAKVSAATEADEQWIIQRLMLNVERCQQAQPVLDSDGNPTGEYRFDAAGANRALELLGKRLGMWIDVKRIDPEESLTDEELDARIAEELAKQGYVRTPAATH